MKMTPAQKWEMLKQRFQQTTKKPHQHTESSLQIECVKWVRATFPHFDKLFFSVPNGGQRNAPTARIMKAEGVVAGVSDLLLLIPNNGYHGLCIEMKTEKGRQSEHQKTFQEEAEYNGYKYIVCRSFKEFASEIYRYQMTWVVTDELLEMCGFYREQTDEEVSYRHKVHKDIELRKYHGFFYTDILGRETLIRKVEHLMLLLVIAGKGDVADEMRRNAEKICV